MSKVHNKKTDLKVHEIKPSSYQFPPSGGPIVQAKREINLSFVAEVPEVLNIIKIESIVVTKDLREPLVRPLQEDPIFIYLPEPVVKIPVPHFEEYKSTLENFRSYTTDTYKMFKRYNTRPRKQPGLVLL
jgi:hypothetical protein